jgi:Tol biopolymer transport system component
MRKILALVACIASITAGHAAEQHGNTVQLVLVDLQGQKKVLGSLPDSVVAPRISPDGKQVAFELTDAPASVKVYVADRPSSRRATCRRSGRTMSYGSCSRVPAMDPMTCSWRV